MWILFTRAPLPDQPYWPGRRVLAVLDALVWPALAWWGCAQVSGAAGLAKAFAAATILLVALRRVEVAWRLNHRYGFTTWRLARVVLTLMLIGVVLKVSLAM